LRLRHKLRYGFYSYFNNCLPCCLLLAKPKANVASFGFRIRSRKKFKGTLCFWRMQPLVVPVQLLPWPLSIGRITRQQRTFACCWLCNRNLCPVRNRQQSTFACCWLCNAKAQGEEKVKRKGNRRGTRRKGSLASSFAFFSYTPKQSSVWSFRQKLIGLCAQPFAPFPFAYVLWTGAPSKGCSSWLWLPFPPPPPKRGHNFNTQKMQRQKMQN
jgi:hypothetical protein